MDTFDISKYIDIALRRKYWIIIPFLFTVLAGLGYTLTLSKIYEAETLILVQPQKVPQNYVRSLVSSDIEHRLHTITQQVTSRTNLERIIKKYNLYSEHKNSLSLGKKVDRLRKMIEINIRGGMRKGLSAFTITFRDKDPNTAMQVTNVLASNFITENLKIRESQALGTSAFLADELESMKRRLMVNEEKLKEYRIKYMGRLPAQLKTNLAILARLQSQLEQLNNNIGDAENRKLVIQKAIADEKKDRSLASLSSGAKDDEPRDLLTLKRMLATLEVRYTASHPDVIRLEKLIAKLAAEESEGTAYFPQEEPTRSKAETTLISQFSNTEAKITKLLAEIDKVQSKIKLFQTMVEEAPKRELELLSLNRDYNNLKGLYNSLLNRKLEAQIAVNLEKKQKGEQFRVIDPAKMPRDPVRTELPKIMLMTLGLGLCLGAGLAYLVEMLDTSFKSPDELEKELNLPVLISMPIRYTTREVRIQKIKKALAAASLTIGFSLSATTIVVATKGVDSTLNFVKTLLDKI